MPPTPKRPAKKKKTNQTKTTAARRTKKSGKGPRRASPKAKPTASVVRARPAKNKKAGAAKKRTKAKPTATVVRARAGTVDRAEAVLARARAAASGNAKRARAIIAEIRKLLDRITESAHRLGLLLQELRDPTLYGALGYDTFEELLRGEDLLSRAHAQKLITVATTYTPDMLRQLGVSKAYALVTYVERTPDPDIAAALARDDAPIAGKPISKATVRDIRRAGKEITIRDRAKNRAGRPKATDPVDDAKATLARIEKRLRAQGIKDLRLDLALSKGRYYLDMRLRLEDADRLVE